MADRPQRPFLFEQIWNLSRPGCASRLSRWLLLCSPIVSPMLSSYIVWWGDVLPHKFIHTNSSTQGWQCPITPIPSSIQVVIGNSYGCNCKFHFCRPWCGNGWFIFPTSSSEVQGRNQLGFHLHIPCCSKAEYFTYSVSHFQKSVYTIRVQSVVFFPPSTLPQALSPPDEIVMKCAQWGSDPLLEVILACSHVHSFLLGKDCYLPSSQLDARSGRLWKLTCHSSGSGQLFLISLFPPPHHWQALSFGSTAQDKMGTRTAGTTSHLLIRSFMPPTCKISPFKMLNVPHSQPWL